MGKWNKMLPISSTDLIHVLFEGKYAPLIKYGKLFYYIENTHNLPRQNYELKI